MRRVGVAIPSRGPRRFTKRMPSPKDAAVSTATESAAMSESYPDSCESASFGLMDDVLDAAMNVLPPLLIGGAVANVITRHPSFWLYLVAVVIATVLIGLGRRLWRRRANQA